MKKTNVKTTTKAIFVAIVATIVLVVAGLLGVSAAETEQPAEATTVQLLGDPIVIEEEPAEVEAAAWWQSDEFAPKVSVTEPTEPTEVEDDFTEPTTAPTEPTTAPTEPTTAPTEPATEPTEPTQPATDPAPTEPEPTEPTTPEPTTPEPTEPTTPEPTTPDPTPEPTPDPTPDYPSDPGSPSEDYYPSTEMDVLGAVKTGEDNHLNVVLAIIALAAAGIFIFLTFTSKREESTRRYQPRHMKR